MWVFSVVHGLMLSGLAVGMALMTAALRVVPGNSPSSSQDPIDVVGRVLGSVMFGSLLYSVFAPWARRRLDLISLAGSFVTTASLVAMGVLLWISKVPLAQTSWVVVPYLLFGLAPGLIGWRTAEPAWMRRFPPGKHS
jgi:hypothetical protein